MGMFSLDEQDGYWAEVVEKNFWKKNYEDLEKKYQILYQWIENQGQNPEKLLSNL